MPPLPRQRAGRRVKENHKDGIVEGRPVVRGRALQPDGGVAPDLVRSLQLEPKMQTSRFAVHEDLDAEVDAVVLGARFHGPRWRESSVQGPLGQGRQVV